MATYLLVDTMNLFFRAKHAGGGKDIDMRVGMAMHVMFNGIKKAWNDFDADHVVINLEGRSWRKDFYTPYKANRKVTQAKRTQREVEDDELFFEAYNEFVDFMREKTNCSVLRCGNAEADDLIATWIQTHPNDNHIILSTDGDFYQLMAPNVKQYNGVTEQTITLAGVFDKKGNPVIDKKTKEHKVLGDPEYVLFEKCVRGDTSDNIFSAYPGARKKGTKNKVGITEAFEDRNDGGWAYNNFMLQRWSDHNEVDHRVRDDFERNRVLIDLTAQPDDVKAVCREAIAEAINKPQVSNVGIHFMKFAGRHNLVRLSEQSSDFGVILNAGIKENTMIIPEDK